MFAMILREPDRGRAQAGGAPRDAAKQYNKPHHSSALLESQIGSEDAADRREFSAPSRDGDLDGVGRKVALVGAYD